MKHQNHHLSIRQTLLRTYIVCQECDDTYDTALNWWMRRFGHRLWGGLGFLLIAVLLIFDALPHGPAALLCFAGYFGLVFLMQIALNALFAAKLRRADDLSPYIVDKDR